MHNPVDLSGRLFLITGASSGIGRESAVLLSQLNARLVLVGRDSGRLRNTLTLLEGTGHRPEVFDLACTAEIGAWVKGLADAGSPGLSVYAASKGALAGLTKSLAVELARDEIRVNCVLPREQFQGIAAEHPLGIGSARDVAHAIAFLLADTGRWITGSELIVDGGYTAH